SSPSFVCDFVVDSADSAILNGGALSSPLKKSSASSADLQEIFVPATVVGEVQNGLMSATASTAYCFHPNRTGSRSNGWGVGLIRILSWRESPLGRVTVHTPSRPGWSDRHSARSRSTQCMDESSEYTYRAHTTGRSVTLYPWNEDPASAGDCRWMKSIGGWCIPSTASCTRNTPVSGRERSHSEPSVPSHVC